MSEQVLLLGGTSFMGRALSSLLTQRGLRVTHINRGRRHWNSEPAKDGSWIECDRRSEPEKIRKAILASRWTAVVDFTCFEPKDFEPVRAAFAEKNDEEKPFYIFICTDNVYSACGDFWMKGKERLIVESDAVRLQDEELRKSWAESDSYGDGKLRVEELLAQPDCPVTKYVSLRLCDVIGPFDSTQRCFSLYAWLSVGDAFPLFVGPKTEDRPLTFVFSEDVAQLIWLLLSSKTPVENGAYNVCGDEMWTLKQFLSHYARACGFAEPAFNSNENKDEFFCEEMFPSVDYAISNSKLKLAVPDWKSTPLEQVCGLMSQFYKSAWHKFPKEREDAIEDFPKKMIKAIRKKLQ